MKNRPIDKSKKSNIKCEHCAYWKWAGDDSGICTKLNEYRTYWRRCKKFGWKKGKDYIESGK